MIYRYVALFFICFGVSLPVLAQLKVVYPFANLVIQRNNVNTDPLHIVGTFSIPVDRIEARLIPVSEQFGQPMDWTVLQNKPQNGVFQGLLEVTGGQYQLEVRGIRDGQTVSFTNVEKVGIGEVFLISGQSNAMGVPGLGAKGATSDKVVSIDAINRSYNRNDVLEASDKLFPTPAFTQLKANANIYPAGETAWYWGELGDKLVERYHVPVALFNAAWPATVAENWSATAEGRSTQNIFVSKYWPYLQPYTNLKNTLQYYNSQFGIRALLWHHGESDAEPLRTPTDVYQRDIQVLINHSRQDFGQNMTWVVARSSVSHATSTSVAAVINAQNALINTPNNNVWPGPNTDDIQVPRPEHGHFENIRKGIQGISAVAAAWNESLNDDFFKKSVPQQPWWFVRTGLVPTELPAGGEVVVPYSVTGFSNNPEFSVQLLDKEGQFLRELGRSRANPIRVRLPDTLSVGGFYSLRVVAQTPVMPGAPSVLFKVVRNGNPARTLLDIQAESTNMLVNVHWLTAQAPAGSKFIIEREDSTGAFRGIGTVSVRTDGPSHRLYTFSDANEAQIKGIIRYRIRHELLGGQIQYSSVVSVGPTTEDSDAILFPNPTNGQNLAISLPQTGSWSVQLYDLSGRICWQDELRVFSNRVTTLNLASGFPDGLYVLSLTSEVGKRITKRLVIKY